MAIYFDRDYADSMWPLIDLYRTFGASIIGIIALVGFIQAINVDLIVAYNFFGGLSPEKCTLMAPRLFPALCTGMLLLGEVLLFAAIMLEPLLPWLFGAADYPPTFPFKKAAILAAGLLLHFVSVVWHQRRRIFPLPATLETVD